MNRRIIQDVVFPSQRQQQDPPQRKEETRESVPPREEPPRIQNQVEDFLPKLIKKQEASSTTAYTPPAGGVGRTGSRSPRVTLWVVAGLVLVIALGVLFSKFFSGATVKITPFNETTVLNEEFVSKENTTEASILPYQRIILPEEERGEEVTETVEKEVSKKASGKIRIFNEYSTESQRLIKNTRFESTAGKIYRIDGSVVVPGVTVSGGKMTPGSVEVTVYADAPGESYNSAPTDFSIPGFKGDPRYGKFYARSETPLAGGFVGKINVPTPEAAEASKIKLKGTLATEMMQKAEAQVPAGFILYPAASFVVFDELGNGVFDPTSTRVSVRGTFYGIMFDKSVLSRFIARETISKYDESPVSVRNIEELVLTPKNEVTDPEGMQEFVFTLVGNPRVVWDVDTEKLKKDLVGIDKRDGFQKVVAAQGAIKKAEANILPVWRNVFPDDPADIKVEEILE